MKKSSNSEDKIKHLPISENEKVILRNKIFSSIHKDKVTRRFYRVFSGIAACLLLLSVAYFYYGSQMASSLSITEYVNSTKHLQNKKLDDVTLFLGEGDAHQISEEEKEIRYSRTGKDISVGSSGSLSQEVLDKKKKAVFNTLVVPYGRTMKTELSDGSTVWLNSGSRLVYPAAFMSDKREVYIEGEAIFEVSHDREKPFFVISDNQTVKVLGTVFSVSNYKDDKSISTILKSGSVKISFPDKATGAATIRDIKLSPGTRATLNKNDQSVVSEKVDVDTYFSWRKGFIVFNKNDLSYIMRRLSRYYNMEVKIKNDTILDDTFSGYLNLNEDVEKVLEVIQVTTEFEYKLQNNVIIIN